MTMQQKQMKIFAIPIPSLPSPLNTMGGDIWVNTKQRFTILVPTASELIGIVVRDRHNHPRGLHRPVLIFRTSDVSQVIHDRPNEERIFFVAEEDKWFDARWDTFMHRGSFADAFGTIHSVFEITEGQHGKDTPLPTPSGF